MNLDDLEQEMLMFSRSSTDCYEADFYRKYIPKLLEKNWRRNEAAYKEIQN